MPRSIAAFLLSLLAAAASCRADELDDLLAKIDARAAELEAQLRKAGSQEARVSALVSRQWAHRVDKNRNYVVATYSFEHATRDNLQLVRNDWDIQYGNGDDALHVRMVTDDASFIWDLGEADYDGFEVKNLTREQRQGRERVVAAVGHVYVVHTIDSETNLWAKLKVLELTPGTSVVFRWEVIADTKDVRALEVGPGSRLRSGRARLQLRAGAVGGNPCRVYLNGRTSASVDDLAPEPLDMEAPLNQDERASAFVDGGCIPPGKVWVLRRVEYSGHCGGDSNGDGPFVLRAGGKELARAEPESGDFRSEWKGRLVLLPGDEDGVYAEISNSSRCDIVWHGVVCDAKWAYVEKFPALTAEERESANALLKELDDDDSEVRDRATRKLVDMGPPLAAYLKELKLDGKSAEVKARVRDILQALEGE